MENSLTRVAILDDDPGMQMLLCRVLTKEYEPRIFRSGKDFMRDLSVNGYDIVLLDLSLPGQDGLEVLRDVRNRHTLPVIIVSGRNNADTIEAGLNLGADDYVTKPFAPGVLCARIRSVLRRYRRPGFGILPGADGIESHPVLKNMFYPAQRMLISAGGQRHLLTERESNVLRILCDKSPGTATRDEIMRGVTGLDWDPSARSLDVHICRLRAKLASATHQSVLIDTVRGNGYRLRMAGTAERAIKTGHTASPAAAADVASRLPPP